MATKWHKTNFPGVRFRQHPTRKHGVQFDKYFTIHFQHNGKRREEGLGWASEGWSEADAYIRRKELIELAKSGEVVFRHRELTEKKREEEEARLKAEEEERLRQERENMPFGLFFEEHYFPHTETEKTWRSCAREKSLFKKHIKPVIGKKRLTEISEIDLQRIIKNMRKAEAAPRSIQYAMAVVRQVFNFATPHYFNGKNPVDTRRLLRNVKIENKRMRFLTQKEAEDLLAALKGRSQQLYEMALVSLHTGARAGEIFHLRWKDVSLEQSCISLLDSKSKDRTVYMTPELQAVFAEKKRGEPGDLIFPGQNGQVMDQVSKTFGRVVDELGFNNGIEDRRQRVTFHTLRHTHASWLVQAGTDLYVVKEQLGHKNIEMTLRYAKLSPQNLKHATETFAQVCKYQEEKGGKVIPMENGA